MSEPRRWFSDKPLRDLRGAVLETAGYRRAQQGEDWHLWIPVSAAGLDNALAAVSPPHADAVIAAVPGAMALSNKRWLWIRLVQTFGREHAATVAPISWLPELATDRADLRARHRPGDLYILKDSRKHRREGISVVDNLDALDLEALDGKTSLVQSVVTDQLEAAGHRLSLRCWVVLVRRQEEVVAHICREGVVVYAPGGLALADRLITRRRPDEEGPGGAPLLISGLNAQIIAAGADPRVLESGLVRALHAAVTAVCHDLRGRAPTGYTCFELFGVDFVVDRQLTPWLLEFNRLSRLDPRFEAERPLREGMLRSAFGCGGVPGFTSTDSFVEVGRWSLA